MTISSSVRLAGPFDGNGVTTSFPFSFKVFKATDMRVIRTEVDGTDTELQINSQFTVTLNPSQNTNAGGVVTMLVPPPTGTRLTLTSSIPLTQTLDLTNQGGFYPEVINNALDRLVMQIQQLSQSINNTVTFPISDPSYIDNQLPSAVARAGKYLTFDSLGNPTAANKVVEVSAVAALEPQITTLANASGGLLAIYANLAEVLDVAANIAAISTAHQDSINAQAASAAAATSANNATGYAAQALSYSQQAASSAAAAKIPTTLAGAARQFLQVKADETGYELVASVAAPVAQGFTLSVDGSELLLTTNKGGDFNVEDYATWTMSENVTYSVANNNLVVTAV